MKKKKNCVNIEFRFRSLHTLKELPTPINVHLLTPVKKSNIKTRKSTKKEWLLVLEKLLQAFLFLHGISRNTISDGSFLHLLRSINE